jgi:hypothetical protein
MEEGTSLPLPDRQFGITTGSKARFRFFSSSTRNEDKPGTVIEDWEEQDIVEVSPIETTLVSEDREEGSVVTVTLNSEVTETGTLQLFASAIDKEDERYRLEFNIRTED